MDGAGLMLPEPCGGAFLDVGMLLKAGGAAEGLSELRCDHRHRQDSPASAATRDGLFWHRLIIPGWLSVGCDVNTAEQVALAP